MRRFAVGILLALILPLTACTITAGDHRHGGYGGYYPPPAHGHWRWDDDLRVYVSVGSPRIYYHDHTYYRWHDNHWSSRRDYNGSWRVIEHRHVPSRLGQRYYPHSQPRYDNRRYDDHRRDDRQGGNWDRRDGQGNRYYNPSQREWQRQREYREAEQRREQQRQRFDGRDDQRWQGLRGGSEDRKWQQQRHDGRQDRQWQQRDQHRQEQRLEQHQQRRAVSQSPSRSREAAAQGNRAAPSRGHDGGRSSGQSRGQGHSER